MPEILVIAFAACIFVTPLFMLACYHGSSVDAVTHAQIFPCCESLDALPNFFEPLSDFV